MISVETPQQKWASSRLEGRTSWIFSSFGRCSRLTSATSGTRSVGLRKGQSPCELLAGLLGFLSRRCLDLRPCVDSVPEPEDSSPVLTWILGVRLESPHGSQCTSWSGKNSRPSRRISIGGALHRKGERNSRVVPPFPESPRCLSPFQGNLFSLQCLDFLAGVGLTPRWHVGQHCGKASWESLDGKPQIP